MPRRIEEPEDGEPTGSLPSSTGPDAWLRSWRKPDLRKDSDPFAGARFRIFIRRDIGRETLDALRATLAGAAVGRWQVVPYGSWKAVDLESNEDLNLIRQDYARAIDAWQNLDGL